MLKVMVMAVTGYRDNKGSNGYSHVDKSGDSGREEGGCVMVAVIVTKETQV